MSKIVDWILQKNVDMKYMPENKHCHIELWLITIEIQGSQQGYQSETKCIICPESENDSMKDNPKDINILRKSFRKKTRKKQILLIWRCESKHRLRKFIRS